MVECGGHEAPSRQLQLDLVSQPRSSHQNSTLKHPTTTKAPFQQPRWLWTSRCSPPPPSAEPRLNHTNHNAATAHSPYPQNLPTTTIQVPFRRAGSGDVLLPCPALRRTLSPIDIAAELVRTMTVAAEQYEPQSKKRRRTRHINAKPDTLSLSSCEPWRRLNSLQTHSLQETAPKNSTSAHKKSEKHISAMPANAGS